MTGMDPDTEAVIGLLARIARQDEDALAALYDRVVNRVHGPGDYPITPAGSTCPEMASDEGAIVFVRGPKLD